jgi:NADPH-dependent glutamate synthase beta subunit-like oxidoreductase/Pyruvate/2-oxoacid:ferredoxin oxidoreductase delta subunit
MGLLNKDKKKKPLRMAGHGAGGPTGGSTMRPKQALKTPPCSSTCPSGNDIRMWLQAIAQREKLHYSEEEAFTRAWNIIVETNPFPSVMGRVCPHPCQEGCNRAAKDGAVAINVCERFIGDWGLGQKLTLPKLEEDSKPESVGVIGAGPGGLSFAYQMARRGYKVTVYEKTSKPGGMIFWGIPFYRQPEDVLAAEVQRILDMGVDLKLNTAVGKDISVAELKAKHQVIYVGIGAHKGRLLRCPGEEGPGVWTGTDYLHRVNAGEKIDLGKTVAVIGGGDTAIDAAREARRGGSEVTIVYRRTREEMPAIEPEIEDALKEGVKLDYLAAPVEIKREGGKVVAMRVQKMELGEPDASGRRRPVPIEGSEYDIKLDAVIAAISQEPEGGLEDLYPNGPWVTADDKGKIADGLWAGGDVINLGLATDAVGHGRRAAEQAHRELRSLGPASSVKPPPIPKERIKMELEDVYPAKPQAKGAHRPVKEWLLKPEEEIALGITKEQFLEEMTRCFSCGQCFGCERCWMYCTPGCFKKVENVKLGEPYYAMKLETCDGCKKCMDECPCGYMDME